LQIGTAHEFELSRFRKVFEKDCFCFRALQRCQDTVVRLLKHRLVAKLARNMGPVLVLHGAIDDDVEHAVQAFAGHARDDQIVEDAPGFIQEHR